MRHQSRNIFIFVLVLPILCLGGANSGAMPSGTSEGGGGGASWSTGSATASKPSEYRQALKLIKKAQYGEAIPLLLKANEKSPNDPDILNELGFAYRQTGQLQPALQYYLQAIKLDPDHKEAREYLGELYLMQRQLPMAKTQLAELERLCPRGCKARETLDKAIAEYEANQAAAASATQSQ